MIRRDTGAALPDSERPRIAVFSGPTATIQNSFPLVTSNKAARRHGLPQLTDPFGRPTRFDALRPQRLAAPVTVYVEAFSGHPLERDRAELYAPPDGYVGADGVFSREPRSPDDKPVFEITLEPEDGLYPLPYMARQAGGRPWDADAAEPGAPPERARQPFYPDASRLFEEIDRLLIAPDGSVNQLSDQADFDFYRVVPSGGYTKGLAAAERPDVGDGDIEPERLGEDFFPYRPPHLRREPAVRHLAKLTNDVNAILASGRYLGGVWLEGSPFVEETAYWLNLLLDTTLPVACCAGPIGPAGHEIVVDAVTYVTSRIWADDEGRDTVGVVGVEYEQAFTARELQKTDSRPGGYIATGGHGGVVAALGKPGPPVLTYRPTRRHTHRSQVNISRLPASVRGVRRAGDGTLETFEVPVTRDGRLLGDAIPEVRIVKHARYLPRDGTIDPALEVEIAARVERNLTEAPLAGFVVEGGTPFGHVTPSLEAAVRRAAYMGMPFVKTGRGDVGGFVGTDRVTFGIAGRNLTATKARLLLMAAMLRFGALPPARDPDHPTDDERRAVVERLAEYQRVFDEH